MHKPKKPGIECPKAPLKLAQSLINNKKLVDGYYLDLNNTKLMQFLDEKVVIRTVHFTMKKILEEWAGVKLDNHGHVYGIRRYSKG